MNKLTVICVDDQRDVLEAVARDLQPLESYIDIEQCESAFECEELMDDLDSQGRAIAVVISDHIMPERTGVELLTRIKKDGRFEYTRKLLLTGLATHQDTIRAINQAAIDNYFEKPWVAEVLIEQVKTLLTDFVLNSGMDYEDLMPILDQSKLYRYLK
ncbi:response regulator [Alginatibacterium sediminis]|uniref:Response regulator n=1 Tax=Alginatibacterium sediminis TaxID=2164068 RepID=A0A420E7L1_9ALTE|nr:response regulator [Alginatibacterium sediminis]RKF14438.1 response regulator [Alginatibacterium sediminis]